MKDYFEGQSIPALVNNSMSYGGTCSYIKDYKLRTIEVPTSTCKSTLLSGQHSVMQCHS